LRDFNVDEEFKNTTNDKKSLGHPKRF